LSAYGCSNDDIGKVKSGVLNIDKTTTVGKAVDGYQYFKNVKWQSATDKQGRRFVFFDAELNGNMLAYFQNRIHEEIYKTVENNAYRDIGEVQRKIDDQNYEINYKQQSRGNDDEIASMKIALKNMEAELNSKKQEAALKLNCVSKVRDSLKLNKIIFHQEFVIAGAKFEQGASGITFYDEHNNPFSEISQADLLDIIYRNAAPDKYLQGYEVLSNLEKQWEQSIEKCTEVTPVPISQPAPVAPTPTTSASTQQQTSEQANATSQLPGVQNPATSQAASSPSSNPVEPPSTQPAPGTQTPASQPTPSQPSSVQPSTPQSAPSIATNSVLKALMDSATTLSRDDANKIASSMTITKQPALNAQLADAFNKIGLEKLWKQKDNVAALENFQKAYENDISNPEYLQNYGYALYLTGNFDGAIQKFVESLGADPKRASVWFSLGEVYAAKGMNEDAYKCLITACKFTRNIKATQKFLQDKSVNSEFPAMREASKKALMYSQNMQ